MGDCRQGEGQQQRVTADDTGIEPEGGENQT
jgi:hypothetical protein